MPVSAEDGNKGLIVAALLALATNWDETERRTGRRGEYRTTGASMYRIRELNPQESELVSMLATQIGIDVDEEDIDTTFNGDYEFQVSYACNRFATKSANYGQQRLTGNEMRTLERAKAILTKKEEAAVRVLTTPDRQKVA